MFNGSENFNDDFFKPLEPVGATNMNGNTWLDRTVYFENVPTSALDMTLWLESDRMGHLLGAIDQKKLDEQRGVVQNEKRQGENQPYGKVDELIASSTYPVGHPYSWDTIGSMEDLNAASLDDVKDWFRAYYGAANAVVVIAGDITAAQAEAEGRAVLRRHPLRPAGQAPGGVDREDERQQPRHDAGQRARRRASTRPGTSRATARASSRCSISPRTFSATARTAVSTSASSTRTRSPQPCRWASGRSRSARSCR